MTNTKTFIQLAEEKKEYRKTNAYKNYLKQSREKRKLYKRELRKRKGIKTLEEKKNTTTY